MASTPAQQRPVFRAGELFHSQPLDGSAWRVCLLLAQLCSWEPNAAKPPAAAGGISYLAPESYRTYKTAVRAEDDHVMQLKCSSVPWGPYCAVTVMTAFIQGGLGSYWELQGFKNLVARGTLQRPSSYCPWGCLGWWFMLWREVCCKSLTAYYLRSVEMYVSVVRRKN